MSKPPALIVTLVHGTYPLGMVRQAVRNAGAALDALRGRTRDEAARWPASAAHPDSRWWFEAGSVFERDLRRRIGGPSDAVVFEHVRWSGRNTFADREMAATRVAAAIEATSARYPDVAHVVVAHSHGGTVAAQALGRRPYADGLRVSSFVTLATPFVRVAQRPGIDPAAEPGMTHALAALLPATLLLLAPLAALSLGLRADGRVGVGIATAAGLLALAALLRLSVPTAGLVVAAAAVSGGAAVRSDVLALTILALVGGAALLSRRLVSVGFGVLQHAPLRFQSPLLALRAPRDEASLVIGTGQLLQSLAQIAHRVVGGFAAVAGALVAPLMEDAPEGAPRWQRAAAIVRSVAATALVGALVGAAAIGVRFVVAGGTPGQVLDLGPGWPLTLRVVVASVLLVAAGLLLCVVAFLGVVLAWALPTVAVGLAAGPEASLLPVLTQVDAEPLPHALNRDGTRRAAMRLEILYDATYGALTHSMYEAEQVRDRLARHLARYVGTGRRPRGRLSPSGDDRPDLP